MRWCERRLRVALSPEDGPNLQRRPWPGGAPWPPSTTSDPAPPTPCTGEARRVRVPLPPAPGYPPSESGNAVLERVRTFIADEGLPMVEDVERRVGDTAFALESDGQLAEPMIGLKRRMQQ